MTALSAPVGPQAVAKKLGCRGVSPALQAAGVVSIVRKSFDARRGKRFTYVVDVAAEAAAAAGARGLHHLPGTTELLQPEAEHGEAAGKTAFCVAYCRRLRGSLPHMTGVWQAAAPSVEPISLSFQPIKALLERCS